jgi:hypothetical protein
LPLPKGTKTFFFKWSCSLPFHRLSIACSSFFWPFLFFFFSLWLPNVCVVNALTKGEIEDLCGSRTSGWLLPGVMSD